MKFHYRNPKLLFHGTRFDVLEIEADHPKSGHIHRQVVDHPGAVVILPMLDRQTVILIRNTRQTVERTLWELPAGTLEPGEEPYKCSLRELEEETGYRAEKMTPLLEFFSTPGFCNEYLYVFLAEKLTKTEQNLDETEVITAEAVPLTKALQMISEGTICDVKTIASLLYFHQKLSTKSE